MQPAIPETSTAELIRYASGFGLVGVVAVILGIYFLKGAAKREEKLQQNADEDRKWIRESGEKQMVLMSEMISALKDVASTLKEVTSTNKTISETNTKLVGLLERSK